jgi:glycosyltransferase involved in cell wall biosynthesis
MFALRGWLRPYYLKWLYFRMRGGNRPDYFRDCWRYPNYYLDSSVKELLPRPGTDSDVLILPMTDWHTRIQRSQHFARAFATQGGRSFCLNPHLGREFRNIYSRNEQYRVGLISPKVVELHVHLPQEPVYHHRMLSTSESRMVYEGIRQLVEISDCRQLVQLISFPLWIEVARMLRSEFGFPIVYDCHDLLEGFKSISNDIIAAELEMMRMSDMVVFSSEWLLEHTVAMYPELRRKSIIIRNAVDLTRFGSMPEMTPSQKHPESQRTIGYAGALDFWFDVEAVELAARRHPEWRFVLLGRIESERTGSLARLPNVIFPGEIAHANLHSHMVKFDAAIIPFLKIPLTLATNPIKVYEYFSCGLPVVTSRLPEMELFGDLLYLANDPEEFVEKLEMALAERDPDLRVRRRALAERESWENRCTVLRDAFAHLPREAAKTAAAPPRD